MKQHSYRTSLEAKSFTADEMVAMLETKIVEPGTSDEASPVVIVLKHDGSYCMCTDHRKLNAVTVRNTY